MSRVGNNPITVPSGVNVTIDDNTIKVSGANGSQLHQIDENIKVMQKDNSIFFNRTNNDPFSRSMHGTTRQIVSNMVIGVSAGFKKELEIIGVGYQASIQGSRLKLQLGFSHDIFFDVPDTISIKAERTSIIIEGNDKQLVGSVASKIRSFRKPEPYKGKGVRYKNENVKIKQGKTVGE